MTTFFLNLEMAHIISRIKPKVCFTLTNNAKSDTFQVSIILHILCALFNKKQLGFNIRVSFNSIFKLRVKLSIAYNCTLSHKGIFKHYTLFKSQSYIYIITFGLYAVFNLQK